MCIVAVAASCSWLCSHARLGADVTCKCYHPRAHHACVLCRWLRSHQMMYKKILEAELEAPHFMSDAALDLCQRLLIRDPALRLGSGASGVEEMKGHAFFRGIDWTALEMKLVRVGRRGGGGSQAGYPRVADDSGVPRAVSLSVPVGRVRGEGATCQSLDVTALPTSLCGRDPRPRPCLVAGACCRSRRRGFPPSPTTSTPRTSLRSSPRSRAQSRPRPRASAFATPSARSQRRHLAASPLCKPVARRERLTLGTPCWAYESSKQSMKTPAQHISGEIERKKRHSERERDLKRDEERESDCKQ